MKRIFSIVFALALVLSFSLVMATPVAAATLTVNTGLPNVPPNYWTIQAAIAAALPNDTIMVAAGTYIEVGQIIINKNLTIIGADKTTTIIKPAQSTTNSGDGKGWFLVNAGYTFNLSKVTLDGSGYLVFQGIRDKGQGTINDCVFKNIKFNESGADYAGTAIVVFGTPAMNVNVTGCTFSQIGRVGVLFYGTGVTASTFSGNTYTGKGVGNWLDYGVEVGAGASATITGNTITNCVGVASVDGSESAGIVVSTYFGAGTTATITGNTLTGNFYGIAVGINPSDTSTVVAHLNNINGNTGQGIHSTAPLVDGTCNWWGANSGPGPVGPGSGDNVSTYVNFDSWTGKIATFTGTGTASFTPSAGNITGLTAVAEGTLPTAGKPNLVFPHGFFSFFITGLSNGQTVTVTITLPPGAAPTQYWKYHVPEGWIQIPMTIVGPPNVITITLVDGGLGDDDGVANGTIDDQGGGGNPGAVGWETYPVSKVRVLLPWIALLAAIAAGVSLLVLRRRRAQS